MRFSFALPFLAFALVSPSTHAARSLPRDELNGIIGSAATNDSSSVFGRYPVGPATTTASFAAEMEAQWETSQQHPSVSAPYMVCDSTPDVSGYARSLNIASVCSLPNIGDRVIHNLPERTCFDAQLLSAVALTCAGTDDHISVTPYTPWLKMSFESLFSSLRNSFDESTLPDKSTIETARYSAFFAEKLSNREKAKKRAAAEEKLQKVWEDTPECVRDGTKDTFDTIFSFQVSKSALKLYQSDSAAFVHPRCALNLVQSLLANPFVAAVEFDPVVTTSNHEARWIIQGSVMNGDTMVLPLHDAGITGLGQVAQMSDTGLSVNSCYFYDSTGEVPRDKSKKVEIERRKVIQYYAKFSSEDEHGHGTHCAGTILGKICTDDGCDTDSTPRDGTAPEAKIAVYDIGTSDRLSPDEAVPMFVTGKLAGATVHSASWGNGVNTYQSRDKDYDKFQYENPDFLVVFAAGNDGQYNTKNSVSAVAKNNLNVCATRNKGQGQGELYAAYFSSMGPSSDGRIKPDICAPGHAISSADNGSARQCGTVGMSGTSMACPGVAGAALLLRQYFMEGYYPSGTKIPGDALIPSGALIKAAILNSGRLMLGRDGSNFPSKFYDESQGFGLISLVDAVYVKGKSKGKVLVWDNVKLTNKEVWTEIIYLDSCSAQHTSITLNYFDKENDNTSCTTCIVNRLDLTVRKGSQILYPNGKTAGPDTKNNAQRIRIPKDNTDSITVMVEGTNLVTENQKFALVISGCVDIGTRSPTTLPTTSKPTTSNFPSLKPSATPSISPSNAPSLSPSVTCVDDPEFFKRRGGRKRTCEYIGKGNKEFRLNKFCNKHKKGELISKSCCKTCKKCTICGCVAGEIPMKRQFVDSGKSTIIQLNTTLNNVRQLVGKSEGTQPTPSSTDFILLNSKGDELGKLNIHATNYAAVVKQSVVFDPAFRDVTAVKLNSLWNGAYLSELEVICDDEENDNTVYARIVKGCVFRSNIILHKNKSVKECADICDSMPNCMGFEYGVEHGGTLGTYEPRDCQPQSSRTITYCHGGDWNLDFYQYPYVRIVKSCVRGNDSKLYRDKSVKECEAICDNLSTCKGFDYGVSYGSDNQLYMPGDCLPQTSLNTDSCGGEYYNLDFYRRDN